jgi:hypothetical protein
MTIEPAGPFVCMTDANATNWAIEDALRDESHRLCARLPVDVEMSMATALQRHSGLGTAMWEFMQTERVEWVVQSPERYRFVQANRLRVTGVL